MILLWQCACGEFDKCDSAQACNCGFGSEGVDDGYIFSKQQLPLSKVIFPSFSGNAGNYKVGRLRCGPKSFGRSVRLAASPWPMACRTLESSQAIWTRLPELSRVALTSF